MGSTSPTYLPSISPSAVPTLSPTTIPSTTQSISPTTRPKFSSMMAFDAVATSPPTSYMQPWLVGPSAFSVIPDPSNIYDTLLHISNSIGYKVKPSSVVVKLFDLNCENEKNKTGTSVVLIETDGPNLGQGDSFSYHLGLDQTKIGGNAGGLVTFTGVGSEGKSKGRIKFCTRVSSYESNIEVSFRESNFDIGFDLTNNIFSLGNVSIQENSPDTFQSNVQSSFQVAACQCKLDFSCYSTGTNPTIQQDDSLTICLQPTGPNAEVVHISNFNIIMSAGSYTYSPVGLGPGSWNSDALTLVSTNGSDDIVKIVTPVVAQFFIQGHDSLDVTGNAFLEYDSSKGETGQGPVYAGFRLSINMFVNNGTGCFQSLFKTIKGAFKRVKD